MKLSVIVCTRNRAYAIVPCLDTIAAALAQAAPLEAEIVVVDSSTDDTSAIVAEWAKSCAFPVQLLFEPKKGLSVARNSGLRAARGELIAWTDDDCRMDSAYVVNLLRHDAADKELVLRGGRVELGDPTDLPLTIRTSQEPQRWNRQMRSARSSNLSGHLVGCNMAMRRVVIDKIGLFDERFGGGTYFCAGEESDYIFRAYLADIPLEYAPDMVVHHFHGRKTIAEGNKLIDDYMIGQGALYAKYLFRHFDFCRPAWWTFKTALRETIAGKKPGKDKLDFSSRRAFVYNTIGALRYYTTPIKGSKDRKRA